MVYSFSPDGADTTIKTTPAKWILPSHAVTVCPMFASMADQVAMSSTISENHTTATMGTHRGDRVMAIAILHAFGISEYLFMVYSF